MAGFLKFLGVVLILVGIGGGVAIGSSADWRQYRVASSVIKQLPDNPYSRADYQAAGLAIWPTIGTAITTASSGIIGGAVLLGLGEGLSLLGAIAVQTGARKPENYATAFGSGRPHS